MPIDFSKIGKSATADTLVPPREIFAALSGKVPKYSYLRDVQAEVLDRWHERRNATDLRLKMNTGGGKTLVGLLILKSCLNENKGPAVYIAPTPYLAEQAVVEARGLGIATETDPRALAVSRGKAILVTSIFVLVNGKSKFGVGNEIKLPIGSLVLDDAHACLSTAEEQFTLRLPATHPAYRKLLNLFNDSLKQQSPVGALDIEKEDPSRLMLVPFWEWHNRIHEVAALLHAHRNDAEIQFGWPLLSEHLRLSRCVFGGGRVEISPRCLPIDIIPSFARAPRRIFMSATFADDSVLVSDFDAKPADIATAIAPSSASDIGDRMILVPQELDPTIKDDDLRALAVRKAKQHNVVVIVPSNRRLQFWQNVASLVISADNLDTGVERLKQGHVGLAVIVNKYDGIDLPDAACRLLVLDGLPDARRAIDRVEQVRLQDTSIEVGKAIQQIEQGMGRGVRSNDDYCVVVLMGRSLVGQLFARGGIAGFTPATRAQYELSEQMGTQLRNKGIAELESAMEYCLTRSHEWIAAAKSALVHIKYDLSSSDLTLAAARRTAFNQASAGDSGAAAATIQTVVNAAKDHTVKGWLMAELAEYTNSENPVEAQKILRSAHALNRQVIRPFAGIDYERLPPILKSQAERCIEYCRGRFASGNALIVATNAVIDDLAFRADSFKRFQRAMRDVALLLGLDAQLPESEYGLGPDVLWAVGSLEYVVIECKNEAVSDKVNKKDCNQLAGSCNWFDSRYDKTCSRTPLLVHPSSVFEYAATPPHDTRVLTDDGLSRFRTAVIEYCTALAGLTSFGAAVDVAPLLRSYHLAPQALLQRYTVLARK